MEQAKKNAGLFEELMEAVEDINQWREGKISLNTYTAESQPNAEILLLLCGQR